MFKRLDFTIPLDITRIKLLGYCIERQRELMISNSVQLELGKYILQLIAVDKLTEPRKILNAVNRHLSLLQSYLSDTVFPYDEKKYEDDSELSVLKAQYKQYIENLERIEKEKELNK